MIIDYRIPLNFTADDTDYSEASEWFLRNEAPLGDIVLSQNSIDFTSNEASIPILDFAYCMNYSLSILKNENEDIFDFLDGEKEIYFKRLADKIIISTNYKEGSIELSFKEFEDKVKDFFKRVEKELKEEYPGLKDNSKFESWYHRKL